MFLCSIHHLVNDNDSNELAIAVLQANYVQRCGNGIIERGEECDCQNEEVCKECLFIVHWNYCPSFIVLLSVMSIDTDTLH